MGPVQFSPGIFLPEHFFSSFLLRLHPRGDVDLPGLSPFAAAPPLLARRWLASCSTGKQIPARNSYGWDGMQLMRRHVGADHTVLSTGEGGRARSRRRARGERGVRFAGAAWWPFPRMRSDGRVTWRHAP